MRNLTPPYANPIIECAVIFKAIRDAKRNRRRTILTNLTAQIEAAYSTYSINTLTQLTPIVWGKLRRKSLIHCYNVETVPLRQQRQTLLNLAGSYCPYCNIDRPDELDHYLPKEEFPELGCFNITYSVSP
jgi:hypothetical protein